MKEDTMDTRDRGSKKFDEKESVACDSRRCLVYADGVWKERFEDLVFGVGP